MNREVITAEFTRWDSRKLGIIRTQDFAEVMKSIGIGEEAVKQVLQHSCTGEYLHYADFIDWLCFPAACVPSGIPLVTTTQFSRTCKFFVGANWKCSLESVGAVDQLVADINTFWQAEGESLRSLELCVFPPYVFLDRVRQQLHPEVRVGSQNAWDAAPGFKSTGVVTAEMLRAVGCGWVLLGHSDRRNSLGETDSLIHDKVDKCLSGGLSVNLTVGETLEVRQAGNAMQTLLGQLEAALVHVPPTAWNRIAVAYEPVWAIGEGATPCSPEEAQRVLAALRAWIGQHAGQEAAHACRLLYTGSVTEKNAEQYACLPDVDGFVVGRAGLDPSKLRAICSAVCV